MGHLQHSFVGVKPVGRRAFWFSNNRTAYLGDLNQALQDGQQVSHFGATDCGVLVITDGIPVSKTNDQDQPVVAVD